MPRIYVPKEKVWSRCTFPGCELATKGRAGRMYCGDRHRWLASKRERRAAAKRARKAQKENHESNR